MDGIITLIILFFVISSVSKLLKKATKSAKKPMTQTQAEATRPRPAVKPAAMRDDYRFPAAKPKAAPTPVEQEGGDTREGLSLYSPITPSPEIEKRFSTFSNYVGSLNAPVTEGADQTKEYKPVAVPYRADLDAGTRILPERLTRDALVQAVVMNEILNRPRRRR